MSKKYEPDLHVQTEFLLLPQCFALITAIITEFVAACATMRSSETRANGETVPICCTRIRGMQI